MDPLRDTDSSLPEWIPTLDMFTLFAQRPPSTLPSHYLQTN